MDTKFFLLVGGGAGYLTSGFAPEEYKGALKYASIAAGIAGGLLWVQEIIDGFTQETPLAGDTTTGGETYDPGPSLDQPPAPPEYKMIAHFASDGSVKVPLFKDTFPLKLKCKHNSASSHLFPLTVKTEQSGIYLASQTKEVTDTILIPPGDQWTFVDLNVPFLGGTLDALVGIAYQAWLYVGGQQFDYSFGYVK